MASLELTDRHPRQPEHPPDASLSDESAADVYGHALEEFSGDRIQAHAKRR